MATPDFKYQETFEQGKEQTEYYLLTKDYISTTPLERKEILKKIEQESLTLSAQYAFHNVEFLLRPEHQKQIYYQISGCR